MKDYWNNRLFKIGAIIALVGWTPLLAIIFPGMIGLLSDPNPIGPGLLFFFSFWPAAIASESGLSRFGVAAGERGNTWQFIQAEPTPEQLESGIKHSMEDHDDR